MAGNTGGGGGKHNRPDRQPIMTGTPGRSGGMSRFFPFPGSHPETNASPPDQNNQYTDSDSRKRRPILWADGFP
jgi:hypothetical protein